MTVHKRFFVICATDNFPGDGWRNFRRGDFVGWDYSNGDNDGPYNEIRSRLRSCAVQDARWFSTKVEAQHFADHHLHGKPIEILHLSLSSV